MSEAERRRYFRVEDEIILFVRDSGVGDANNHDHDSMASSDVFTLTAALARLTADSRGYLRRVERQDPDVAEFLKMLEHKIDCVARTLLNSEIARCEQSVRKVNLSASGAAFSADWPYAVGSVLELNMVLPTTWLAVSTKGRVVYCEKNESDADTPYRLAVDFIDLSEADQNSIARHVIQKQARQLRDRKTGAPSE
jgi:hypothetical protein